MQECSQSALLKTQVLKRRPEQFTLTCDKSVGICRLTSTASAKDDLKRSNTTSPSAFHFIPILPSTPVMATSPISRYAQISSALVIVLSQTPGTHAIHRSIGALDPIIKTAVDACFALPDRLFEGKLVGYGAGKCPNLINCIMGGLQAADQAGLSAGTSIATLCPTVLALVGE